MGEQGRVCLIGFAGWKDRDPEHSTLLSHSITATGHIMRARAISSPQTGPRSHTGTHAHTLDYSIGSYLTRSLPTHLPVFPDANIKTHTHAVVKWDELFFQSTSSKSSVYFCLDNSTVMVELSVQLMSD